MSKVAEWANEICDELTKVYMRSGSLDFAVQVVYENYLATGHFEDKEWLRSQILAVRNNPEQCGHASTYWQELRDSRIRGARARRHASTAPKGREDGSL